MEAPFDGLLLKRNWHAIMQRTAILTAHLETFWQFATPFAVVKLYGETESKSFSFTNGKEE